MLFSGRQYVFLYGALLGSMFAGASLVHALLQPDLTLRLPTPAAAAAAAAATAAPSTAGDATATPLPPPATSSARSDGQAPLR
jgi:hypothetical protein